MKVIFQKNHVKARISLSVILFSLFFFVPSSSANQDIFLMIQRGDIDCVREFIAEIDNVDIRNHNQETPLHIAARLGFVEIVELLVSASADVNARNVNDFTPLHHAVNIPDEPHAYLLENKAQIAEFLLLNGADVNTQARMGLTPLMALATRSAWVENAEIITRILDVLNKSNLDLNVQSTNGGTALSMAASEANENVVAWLIENNADVDLADVDGMTALHWGAWEGNGEVTQMLIDAGADINALSVIGANALWYAAAGGNLEAVLILLGHGLEVNLHVGGATPLHVATGDFMYIFGEREGESFYEIVERRGVPRDNFLLITKALVEAGADVYAQYSPARLTWFQRLRSRTAYDLAQEIGNREVADYLRSVMRRTGWRAWWPF